VVPLLRWKSILISAVMACWGASAWAAPQTPTSIRAQYGFDKLTQTGAGQTIAIIAAYNDPSVASDLAYFNNYYGLPAASLTVVNQTGGTTLPDLEPAGSHDWERELSLDVQWAHVIAPAAKILVVAAESPTYNNLFAAVRYAKTVPGVSTVSMSFAGVEFVGVNILNESAFNQPANPGVTFIAASGDNGAELNYPASSPQVMAVGGTTINANGSESAWAGSGGGYSSVFRRPAYQNGVNLNARRGVPDVAYDGDPASGFPIYNQFNDSTNTGEANWLQLGGTSAGAPQWAGLLALANQERVANGLGSLTTDQTLGMLYALYNTPYYAMAFNDITSGSNGYDAVAGYDPVTGLGTPKADFLVPYLGGSISIPEPGVICNAAIAVVVLRRSRAA
jgi:subtilase family serine protease